MQKKISILDYMFILRFFINVRSSFAFGILSLLTMGFFSNSAFAQLPLEDFSGGIPTAGTNPWLIASRQTVNGVPVGTSTITSNWSPTTATGGYLSTPGTQVNPTANVTVGTKAEYFMITPQFVTPAVTEIRFHTKQGAFANLGATYELRLSLGTQADLVNYSVVESWTEAQLNVSATTYEEKIVTLPTIPPGTSVYLAFVAITNQVDSGSGTPTNATRGDTWFVDNVRVINSCAKVAGISAIMGANGGNISWLHDTANEFQIQIVPKGAGIAASGEPVTGKTYSASGLADGTEYDVYLKTICDSNTGSLWAGPFPIKTQILGLGCSTPIVIPNTVTTTPYVLSTNLNKFHEPQGYTPLDSKGLSCQPPSSTQNWLLGDHAFLSYTPTASGLVNVSQVVNVDSSQGCYNALSSVFIFDDCNGIGTTATCLGSMVTGDAAGNSVKLENIYLEGGKTYYFVISSPFQQTAQGASICFTFTLSAPSCPIPSGMAYENLLDKSVTLSWANPQNLVGNWQYLVKPASQPAPAPGDAGKPTATNLNVNEIDLTADTNYNLYVRSVCSGTPGPWSAGFPFRTQCATFTLPYSTQFTNSTDAEPQCWYSVDLNKDGRKFVYAGAPDSPPVQGQIVRLRTMDSKDKTNDMLVSPRVTFDGVKQKQIRYKFKGFGGYTDATGYVLGESSYKIVLSSTGIGPNNFTTELLPIATYQTGNNYIEKIVVVPAGIVGDVNIAWFLPPGFKNTATNFYLDDVYIEDLPDCSPASYPGVTAGTITQNSAEFYWTNGYNNQKWDIKVQPLNSGVPTTGGKEVDASTGVVIDAIAGKSTYLYTGLTPSTQYEFYIRTVCDGGKFSDWVGPVKFNTLCDALPVPYFESFNDTDVTTKKFCWSVINKNGDNNSVWTIDNLQATIMGRDLPFNPFVSYDDYLVSSQINVVGQKLLKFKYKVVSNIFNPVQRGNFELIMSADPTFATHTVLIPAQDFNNADFLENSVVVNGTGPVYFAFHLPADMNDPKNTGLVTIDDFSIENLPLCPNPTVLKVANILTDAATLSWTKGASEAKWEVAIQKPDSGVPTGTGTEVFTNPTYNATGLIENTAYEYYVRAVCDTDKSEWIGPLKFRTTCSAIPTPFIETFEKDSATESCWTIVNNNGDGNVWDLNMPVTPMFGEQMAALNCFKNGDNEDWLISPTLMVKPNQRLRFHYSSKYLPDYLEDLKVQISTQGVDISNFTTTIFDTEVSGVITNVEPKEMVLNLTGITSPTNINIAFHVPPGAPNAAGNGVRGSYLNIDNVIVEDIPACPSVYNVVVTNVLDKSATINWTAAGSETAWEVSVQPYGTPAPVGDTQPQYLHTATSHPYTINGLIPSQKYQFYVRAICSDTSESQWVGPFEILTKCDTAGACMYTISLTNGNTGQVQQGIDVIQNGVVQQTLTFPPSIPNQTPPVVDYQVFLCSGIEFSLYWRGQGSGLQYSQAQCIVKDQSGNVVFTSPLGLGTINSTIFKGVSVCTPITCPQPTNLAVSNVGELSWNKGGSETQWEVAVQPLGHGTIPQSGVLVDTQSYVPVASDFALAPNAATHEFFVRAVCGTDNESFWTGPMVFVRNDEPTTAIALTVNSDSNCTSKGVNASFLGATVSTTPTACPGVNGGDIWFEFVATSRIHTVELSNWNPGSYYTSSYTGAWPKVMMSLYEVQVNNTLVEKACSENNSLVAIYSSELIVGKTYKIRIKLDETLASDKRFDICVSTPNTCDMDAFNYSFEKLAMQSLTGISSIINYRVVPGWRVNTDFATMFFHEASNSPGTFPYEGSQCIQLTQDNSSTWDPNSPDIRGLYKDFDTSMMVKMKYSFASASRLSGNGTTVELWAGLPSGPFTKITEHNASSTEWTVVAGNYDIPTGQATTRFIFRTKGYAIGHMLDAANFKENTDILTSEPTLACNESTVAVAAEGLDGEWLIDPNNPAPTVIDTPNSNTATISGITVPGAYTYYWKTRYCEKPFVVTLQEISEVPTVVSPVEYCITDTAVPLTATAPDGFTLLWYTEAVGGTGSTVAPTPIIDKVGTTTYYVNVVNSEGCQGPRVPIDVVVKEGPCSIVIPKGISPDGDGLNDDWDLTILEANRVEIFNRYGTEVYSQDNYTDQWHGQTNSGKALPDGTYFYQIHLKDNRILDGWVYINKKKK